MGGYGHASARPERAANVRHRTYNRCQWRDPLRGASSSALGAAPSKAPACAAAQRETFTRSIRVHVTAPDGVARVEPPQRAVLPGVPGRAGSRSRARPDLRVVEFTILGNHVHLIVEADGPPDVVVRPPGGLPRNVVNHPPATARDRPPPDRLSRWTRSVEVERVVKRRRAADRTTSPMTADAGRKGPG